MEKTQMFLKSDNQKHGMLSKYLPMTYDLFYY